MGQKWVVHVEQYIPEKAHNVNFVIIELFFHATCTVVPSNVNQFAFAFLYTLVAMY